MKKLLITCLLLGFLALPALADGDTETPKHEIFGIQYVAYGGFTMSRISYAGSSLMDTKVGAQWSPGFKGGLSIDAGESLYFEIEYEMHDVLSETEVVPWDGTFRLTLGGYL